MNKCIRIILNLLFFLTSSSGLYAGNPSDSTNNDFEQYVIDKLKEQIRLNSIREARGEAKNFIVHIDMQQDVSGKVKILNQYNTSYDQINLLWDFTNNPSLQQLSQKLNDFSSTQNADYYLIVAAIYNFESKINEVFSLDNVKWKEVQDLVANDFNKDSLNSTTGVSGYRSWVTSKVFSGGVVGKRTVDTLFQGLITKANQNLAGTWDVTSKPVFAHFLLSLYVPDEVKYTSLNGVVFHTNGVTFNSKFTNDQWRLFKELFSDINDDGTPDFNDITEAADNKEQWLMNRVDKIQQWYKDFASFDDQLMSKRTQAEMVAFLKERGSLLTTLLKGLDTAKREHVINTLCEKGKSLVDQDNWLYWWGGGKGSENLLLKVLESTPKEQSGFLKRLLTKDDYALFIKMATDFDDAGVWGTDEHYTEFAKTLASKMLEALSQADMDSIVAQNRMYYFNKESNVFRGVMYPSFEDLPASNEQTYFNQSFTGVYKKYFNQYKSIYTKLELNSLTSYTLTKYTDLIGRYHVYYSCDPPGNPACSTQVYTNTVNLSAVPAQLSPFDYVMIIPKQDIIYNGYSLRKEELYFLPVFYFKWLDKKGWNEIAEKVTVVAISAVGVLSGVGAIAEAGTWTAAALAGAETFFATTQLVNAATGGQFDEMVKSELGESGYGVYKVTEGIFNIYSIGKGFYGLTKGAVNTLKSAAGSFRDVVKNTPSFVKHLKESFPEKYQGLKSFFASTLGENLDNIYSLASDKFTAVFTQFKASLNSAYIASGDVFKLLSKPGAKTIVEATDNTNSIFKIDIGDIVEAADDARYTEEAVLQGKTIKYMLNGTDVAQETGDIAIGSRLVNNVKEYCVMGKYMCFTAGTSVATISGKRNIEDVKEGDEVYAFDNTTHTNVKAKVTNVFKRTASKLVKLMVSGSLIVATPEHPFYTGGQWVAAKELHAGSSIATMEGERAVVQSIQELDSIATVYNFEVENYHNYFVGNQGLLVHNDCVFGSLSQRLGENFKKLQMMIYNVGEIKTAERLRLYKWMAALNDAELTAVTNKFLRSGKEFLKLASEDEAFCNFFKSAQSELQEILITRAGVSAFARTRNSVVAGKLALKYKKFPVSKNSSGNYVLEQAKKYQAKFSGDADLSFEVNGVSFDDFVDGVLVDAKYGYGKSVFKEIDNSAWEEINDIDDIINNQSRADKIIEQANRQLRAVQGRNLQIQWNVSTELGQQGIEKLFQARNINISVKYVPL